MIGPRHLAPAGTPIRVSDLRRFIGQALFGRNVEARLSEAFCERFGVRQAYAASTGRAALTVLLKALRALRPDRDELILPSYTCYSVAASAVKAGLRVRIVDVSPATLDYAPNGLQQADFSRVLAVVATNLYGLPNDLATICDIARGRGAFVIDDAAQAMGASFHGRQSGTWGDAGLFSFDKGKNVAAIDGGVVVSNSPAVAGALGREFQALEAADVQASIVGVGKVLAYALLLRPSLYWIPNGIPQLELGKTVFTTEFTIARPPRPLAALALTMFERLDQLTAARRATAAGALAALRGVPGIQPVAPVKGAAPAYLRLPVLVSDAGMRDRTLRTLLGIGIGATGSYPLSLADLPELKPFVAAVEGADGGRHVARHIVTLPTHAFVTSRDIARAVDAMSTLRRDLAPAIPLQA